MKEFLPGDIVAVEARPSLKALNWLVSPYTDRGHYFILGNKIKDTEDRVIYESLITSGVRIGKLSWYEGKDIEVFRVSKEVGAEVGKVEGELAASRQWRALMNLIKDPAVADYASYGPTALVLTVALFKGVSSNEGNFKSSYDIKSGLQSLIKQLGGVW